MKTDQPQRIKLSAARRGRRQKMRRPYYETFLTTESLEPRVFLSSTYAAAVAYELSGPSDFTTIADFNGDTHRDIAISSYESSSVSILLGAGDGTFELDSELALASAPDFITSGDVNADGDADLITVSYADNAVHVLLGNGDGTFQSAASYSAGTGPRAVTLGDFTGDGKLDIAVAKSFSQSLTILINDGDGTFQSPLNSSLSFVPVDLTTADFNADGDLDLGAVDFFGNKAVIMLGLGDGTFQTAVAYTTPSGPASVFAADVNADQIPDLLTANLDDGTITILLGVGNGTLQSGTSLPAGSGATFVAAADLDYDDNIDLITADSNADTISVLWGSGAGTFNSAVSFATGVLPRALSIGNFDSSGALDIVVAQQGSSSVSVFLGGDISSPHLLADAGGPYTVNEEGSITLAGGSLFGVGELAYEWDLDNDGIFGEEGSSASRGDEVGMTPTFSAFGLNGPGTYPVALRVSSSNDETSDSSATITIANVPPALAIGGASSVASGSVYTLTLSAAYVGLDSITSWFIDWGDGATQTVNGSPASVTKTYSTTGTRQISATATDADGTYSATSKTISVVPPTPADTIGNGTTTAKNLGGLKATSVKAVEEYIGPADRNDYFTFTTSSVMKIDAKLYNLTDNADLMLLNSAGTRLAYAKHTGTTIERFTVSLQPGTYYLRALSAGTIETPYRLRVEAIAVTPPTSTPTGLSTAKNLGAIAAGGVKSLNDSVATGNTSDFFKFTISASRAMSLKLTGLSQNANLELLDSKGKAIKSSARAGTSDESIASTLVTGTYYAKVTFAGTSTANYRLRVAAA